jgi:hypothetical protein
VDGGCEELRGNTVAEDDCLGYQTQRTDCRRPGRILEGKPSEIGGADVRLLRLAGKVGRQGRCHRHFDTSPVGGLDQVYLAGYLPNLLEDSSVPGHGGELAGLLTPDVSRA